MNTNVRAPAYIAIWNGIVKNRSRILIASFAAAVISLAASALLPKTYEGVLLIRIGQITTTDRNPVPIEQPKVVLDRLRNPAFLQRVSERAFQARDLDLEFYTRGLPASTMEIKAREGSVREVTAALQAAFIEIRAAHEQIASPYMATVRDAVADAQVRMDGIRAKQKDALARMGATAALTDQRAILAAMANETVQADISDLRDKEMSLRRSLLPPFTYMTEMVEPIYASSDAISPDPILNTLLTVLVVLAISIFLVALQVLQAPSDYTK